MRKIVNIILIFFLFVSSVSEARQSSKTSFVKDINVLFLKENYSALIRDAEKNFNRQRLSRKEKKEVLCLMGVSYIKIGEYLNARKVFRDVLEIKGEEYREDAYIGIADSYFYEKRYESAIKSYSSVLNIYPRTERIPSIYYNMGLSYKALKNYDKANYYLQKVKKDYGKSFEADKAAYIPTKKKVTYYVVQVGAFSSLSNAKKLARKLRRKKYDYYIQKITKDGNVLYRVRCGKFSNKSYAMRLKRRLRRDRFYPKIIEE